MANATVTGASLSGIYGRLNGVSGYHPVSANTFADWSVQAGDVVSVIRGEDSYESPVHTSRMVWKGAPEIELNSTGNKEREAITKVARKKYGRGSSAINTEQSIYREFTSSDGLLHSAIYMSASILRTEFYASESTIYSYIEQTASGIRQTVANTASGLQSQINQQANKISLVVEGTGSNAHINRAAIVASINGDTSSVVISADQIDIDGVVSELAARSIGVGSLTVEGVGTFYRGIYSEDNIASDEDIRAAGALYSNGQEMKLANAVVSGTDLILTYTDGTSTTFSKAGSATTLSGSWSGNTYTVTASPQGNTISVTPFIDIDIPQAEPTAHATVYMSTYRGGGTTKDHHDTADMYLVKNGLTVMLKSTTATTGGQVYAKTILSDANLVAGNIKSGVTIFGVAGSYSTDSAKNEVIVKPFTANVVTSLQDHRTFTYTTDAPTPSSSTPQVDTWYLAKTGFTTGTDYAQPGTLKVGLRYGSASGTTYAQKDFTVNHVELWNSAGTAQITSKTISSTTTFYPWCQVDGSWVKGSAVTITPSGSSYAAHASLYCTSITGGSTYTVKFTASMAPTMGSKFQTNKSYTMYWNWPS